MADAAAAEAAAAAARAEAAAKAEAKAAADRAATARAAENAAKRFDATKAQVDEVVDIMRLNVDKVLERDQKLSSMEERADTLQHGAAQFESSAGALKRQMWLKNLKMYILMGLVGTLFSAVVIFWIVSKVSPKSIPEPLQPFIPATAPAYPPPYPYMPPPPPPPPPVVPAATEAAAADAPAAATDAPASV